MANPRIEDLRKRIEKEPGSRLFAQLAEELRKEGELAEAIRVCREGLQKQPNYPSAHMTLGRALFDTGDLPGARAEFEAVLKGAADNILASRLLGECLERLGDAPGALARLKATLALAPGDRQVAARVEALERGRTTPAEVTLVMGVTAGPAAASAPGRAVVEPKVYEAEPEAGEPEPPPIPLSAADESFELEHPFEAQPSAVGSASWQPAGTSLSGPAAAGESASADEAPIPLAAADESFELERPYEQPATLVGAATGPEPASAATLVAVAPPAPASSAPEALYDFEPGAAAYEPPAAEPESEAASFEPEFGVPTREASPPAPTPGEVEMSTATLAELYFSQGVMDKALEVYRHVLDREPGNERARTRLAEIEALDRELREEESRGGDAGDPRAARRQAVERTIARLEGLLAALKRG